MFPVALRRNALPPPSPWPRMLSAANLLSRHNPMRCFRIQSLPLPPTSNLLSPSPCLTSPHLLNRPHLHLHRSLPPIRLPFFPLLHRCISPTYLSVGQRPHPFFVRIFLHNHHLRSCPLLLQMYSSSGAMDRADLLLADGNQGRIHYCNSMIKELIRHGKKEEAFKLYGRIEQQCLQPNEATVTAILSACTRQCDLDVGKVLHSLIVEDGYIKMDNLVSTALVGMYGKCGDLESALDVSVMTLARDTVGWNALFSVNGHHANWQNTMNLFEQMLCEGVLPNRVTLVSVLSACVCNEFEMQGRKFHTHIISSRCGTDTVIGTALVNMYGKCGVVDDAWKAFNNLKVKDVVAWNAIIAVFTRHDLHSEALHQFQQMKQEGDLPDKVTFITILDSSEEHLSLHDIRQIHTFIICCGFASDTVVGTSMINMYGKCNSCKDAWNVFHAIGVRDFITWNAMLSVQVHFEEGKQTYQFYSRMLLEGVVPCRATFASALSACISDETLAEGKRLHAYVVGSKLTDIVLANTVVNMYGKCGRLDYAEKVFGEMPERDLVSWNALLAAYSQEGYEDKAWELLKQMQVEGLLPDEVTFVSILDACVTEASLTKGKLSHCYIISNKFNMDAFISTALVNMYGKCGSLNDAENIFNRMQKRTIVSWNAFLATFSHHGNAKQTIHYFEKMKQELGPDKATFTIVLTACSHAGLVDEACDFFSSMTRIYKLTPSVDHYACLIDLLGRAGRLEEAENLLKSAPCEHNTVLYKTLLGACRHQIDVERGENAARVAFQLDQCDPTPFVMLLNIYSAAERTACGNDNLEDLVRL